MIVFVSAVTLLYSLFALFLAQRNRSSVRLTRSLILANWLWSVASVVLIYLYFLDASIFDKLFLILQVLVVPALAYFEGPALKQLQAGITRYS
jgi:hypothetical protein